MGYPDKNYTFKPIILQATSRSSVGIAAMDTKYAIVLSGKVGWDGGVDSTSIKVRTVKRLITRWGRTGMVTTL